MMHPGGAQAARPVRLPAGGVMLFLSVSGMAIGLAIDCGTTPPALIAALCADAGSAGGAFAFHAEMMPASYAMTAVAAILAAGFNATAQGRGAGRPRAARVASNTATVLLMLLGMFAGGWLAPDVAAGLGVEASFVALVGGMIAGMIAATVAALAIARLVDAAIARRTRSPVQYIMYQ